MLLLPAIVLIILLMIIIIFLAPIHISMSLEKSGPLIHGYYKIRWLGITFYKGDISPPTPEQIIRSWGEETDRDATAGRTEGREEDRLKKGKKQKREPSLPSPNPKEIMEALPALARVAKDLIGAINLNIISCHICFGWNDPADTAIISGYIWSLVSAAGLNRANIRIDPYFEGERLDGSLLADIKARLLWVALAMIKALGEEKIRNLVMETARRGAA
jgi:hypothetical protein